MHKLIAIALAALFIPMLHAHTILATMPALKTPSLPLLVFIAIAAVQFVTAVVIFGSRPDDQAHAASNGSTSSPAALRATAAGLH